MKMKGFYHLVNWLLTAMTLQLLVLNPAGSVVPPFRSNQGHGQAPKQPARVLLSVQHHQVVLDNGEVQINFSNPEGFVTGIQYKGSENLLDHSLKEDDRGYWDIVCGKPGDSGTTQKIKGTKFQVIKQDANQVELSFSSTWNASSRNSGVPLNIDKRFIMLAGQAGIYSYGIFDRPKGSPDLDVDQIRIVFKLWKDRFNFMAISDERQRTMPLPTDRDKGHSLAYPEAVRISRAANPAIKGEVDDKYQYSCENKDNRVHGWISFNPAVGFWVITPSNEFRTAGPVKQDLTSHVGPTALSMFVSVHYAGEDTRMRFRNGESWRKVFGPVFMYLNSAPSKEIARALWQDAKTRMMQETNNWPYNFPLSKDFPSANERGSITGRLLVCDRYAKSSGCTPAANAHVGLATQGPPGSWQTETKGYQFWTETDSQGNFLIKSVRNGEYGLFAWVPGVFGEYKCNASVAISSGSKQNMGVLKFTPPRHGPTLWEIGIPDRTAAEFYIPDPSPEYVNRLYIKQDRYRQYGLWQRYTDLYPKQDLIYTVGVSDYRKDWFYAHVTRKLSESRYQATTWQILFDLQNVSRTQSYVLQLALASATGSALEVRVNDGSKQPPHFTTGLIGRDNAIARHGIHGLYWQYSVNIQGARLHKGRNTIFLTQRTNTTPFQGVMYDYLRLEGPPTN